MFNMGIPIHGKYGLYIETAQDEMIFYKMYINIYWSPPADVVRPKMDPVVR